MFALFEEAGKFHTGRVLSEAEASSQIELDSGKRVKVKSANVLLKFEQPAPAELMREAQAVAAGIELELAWEFAPEDEFGFADLAREYFSERPTLAQAASMIDAAIEAADRYYPAFDFMVRGNKKPQEAIDACLFETVGNA